MTIYNSTRSVVKSKGKLTVESSSTAWSVREVWSSSPAPRMQGTVSASWEPPALTGWTSQTESWYGREVASAGPSPHSVWWTPAKRTYGCMRTTRGLVPSTNGYWVRIGTMYKGVSRWAVYNSYHSCILLKYLAEVEILTVYSSGGSLLASVSTISITCRTFSVLLWPWPPAVVGKVVVVAAPAVPVCIPAVCIPCCSARRARFSALSITLKYKSNHSPIITLIN